MELYKFRWNEARSKYVADLQANGLIRWASMQIWNKQGKSQLGWLFEYSDPDAYTPPIGGETKGSPSYLNVKYEDLFKNSLTYNEINDDDGIPD